MKKTLLAALIVATVMPTMAMAQTRDLRYDRREIRQQDPRQAQRQSDPRKVQNVQREGWRDYRSRNRAVYARGNWRAPFAYQKFRSGTVLRPNYYNSRYYISNPARYRLPPATGANRWVRHYDDVLLVNTRTGRVVQVINGFFW